MSVCVGDVGEPAKRVVSIEIPFGGLTHVGPRNHVLHNLRSTCGRIHLQRGGVTSWRYGFLPDYFGHIIIIIIIIIIPIMHLYFSMFGLMFILAVVELCGGFMGPGHWGSHRDHRA